MKKCCLYLINIFGDRMIKTGKSTISVCLCTCNGGKFLSDQLESISCQSIRPDQLVISDDCSTDNTLDIVENFSNQVSFPVKLVVNKGLRLGVTENFERALRFCDGDVIIFSDQDDVWRNDKIQIIKQAFEDSPESGYFFSNAIIIDSEGLPQPETLWSRVGFSGDRRNSFRDGDQIKNLLRGSNPVYGMTMSIRASGLPMVLPIESKSGMMTHDVWIAIILSALSKNGLADPRCLVNYRQHEDQVAGAGESRGHILSRLVRSLMSARVFDENLPVALDNAARRVKENLPSGGSDEDYLILNDKAEYLRRRALASNKILPIRFAFIIKELFLGRYRKFSVSKLTPIRDLLG